LPTTIHRYKVAQILFIVLCCGIFACRKKQFASAESIDFGKTYSKDSLQNKAIVIDAMPNKAKFARETLDIKINTLFYETAFNKLENMLAGKEMLSFKDAVFTVENAFYDNTFNRLEYDITISYLTYLCNAWCETNKTNYKEIDSAQVLASAAIYKIITDSIIDIKGNVASLPYTYDFNDNFAQLHWQNMFVTKLLNTHKGNCHSLPFLYKILADEMKVKAYLSFLPNHIYIKQKCKKSGWYNTELTNNMFPHDAWLMASGYVSREAIVSGIYMDTISDKQSISICLNDLAKGYLRKFKNNANLDFVIQCCDLGLQYFPNYAELLLLKAETLKKMYETNKTPEFYTEMENTYALLVKLHYREVPSSMFNEWITTMKTGENIYSQNK